MEKTAFPTTTVAGVDPLRRGQGATLPHPHPDMGGADLIKLQSAAEGSRNAPGMVVLPDRVVNYLAHVVGGVSMRQIAAIAGCAPSTVMRQVRQLEEQRENPLVDQALHRCAALGDICRLSCDLPVWQRDRRST